MTLAVHQQISIAEIVIYTPFLAGGIFLSLRHGFGRNAGWLYLILFSLIRIVGAALDLATISNPTTIGLYIGAAVLQNIGLSALILILLGLIGRVLTSITTSGTRTAIQPNHLRFVQTLVIVGLILGIVGGSKAGSSFSRTGSLQSTSETQAGLGLMIAGFAILSAATVLIGAQVQHAEHGERRIVPAVAASLPFVLVRLVYSCVGTYGNNSNFKPITGNPYIQLGMSVIMEIVVVLICEVTGFTLRKVPKPAEGTRAFEMDEHARRKQQYTHEQQMEGRV